MEMVTVLTNTDSNMNSLRSRQVAEQIKEMRAMADAALQLERGGTISLRDTKKKQRHSITDLLEHYLAARYQKRGGCWAGQKVTREELEVFARERGCAL